MSVSKKIKVGFTVRHDPQENRGDFDIIENEYISYYPRFGIIPIVISAGLKDPIRFIKDAGIEAVIIAGGNGVSKGFLAPEGYSNRWSEARENLNGKVLEYVLEKNMPYFGICTGLHQLNAHLGGRLGAEAKTKNSASSKHNMSSHTVTLTDARTKRYFKKEKVIINSYHTQIIEKNMLSGKLKAFGEYEKDRTIEGAYHPSRRAAAIAWHPERFGIKQDEEFNEKLVRAFVKKELFWK